MRSPIDAVGLTRVMERTSGHARVCIGLIDTPVAVDHSDLVGDNIRQIVTTSGESASTKGCDLKHGTSVAGILLARRGSRAPAICPDCTLLVRPVFSECGSEGEIPRATAGELAEAVIDCVEAGAQVLNLSVAIAQPLPKRGGRLEEALTYAASRNAIVVAASGNNGTIGGSAIPRHPWVIPVVACDRLGRPMGDSDIGGAIGRRGLRAPGEAVTTLAAGGATVALNGTSAAAPFVTGTIALLLSAFSWATAALVRVAIGGATVPRRTSIVPPLLNAWAAYRFLAATEACTPQNG